MKTTTKTWCAALLATPVLAAPALAQEPVVSAMQQSELRGNWIIGSTVYSPQDETIGRIEDVIIDSESGAVTAAVLSVGGFLGFGAKQIAVDWEELQVDYDGSDITLNLTREEADAAAEYAFRDQDLPPPPTPQPDPGAAPPPPTGGMGGTGSSTGTLD
jgi:sporulation protein YlmC with PRC-barrel domain